MSATSISCPNRGARPPRRLWGVAVLALLVAFLLVLPARAQNLGEIARQERERRAKQQATDAHVYTNDDLKQPRILMPEDQERAAKRKDPPLPPAMPMEPAAIDPNSDETTASNAAPAPPVDLGEVAREERKRKAAEHAMAHVYTNDDLGRTRILVPADIRRVEEARKHTSPLPATAAPVAPETARASSATDELPLGDIARHYRALEAVHPSVKAAETPARNYPFPQGNATLADPTFAPPAASSPAPARPKPAVLSATRREEARPAVTKPQPATRRKEARPASAPPQDVEATDSDFIRVRPGDSLWRLAQKHLGRGKDWKRIAAANPQLKNPQRLRVGTLLRLP